MVVGLQHHDLRELLSYNETLRPYVLPEKAPDAPGQLYNLNEDPGETTNLYFEHPETVEKLRTQIYAYRDRGRSRPRGSAFIENFKPMTTQHINGITAATRYLCQLR